MKRLLDLARKNPGLSLLAGNLVLLVLLGLTYNPFGLGSYAKAKRLLAFEKSDIRSVTIHYPDGAEVALDYTDDVWPVRKEPGPENPAASKTKPEAEHRWKAVLRSANPTKRAEEPRTYIADRERLRDLLEGLDGLRRYYDIPATDDNRKKFEIDERSLAIVLRDTSGKEQRLSVGLVGVRGDASYVLVDGESSLYQVESNVKSRVGSGDATFFRDRSVFPPDLNSETVASIAFLFPGNTVRIAKAGSEWQMIEPEPGKLREEAFRPLLDDLMGWKARSFPEHLPEGAKRQRGRIEITYHRGSTDPGLVQVDIEAMKDYGSYFVRIDKNLYEVSSYYLEDIKEPKKMLDRPGRGR